MSWQESEGPVCTADETASPIELVIAGRARDLGSFEVRRLLPSPHRQMVGPFIFFDQMGPADLPPGRGIDVRPHPHIGLATVTYLFVGEIVHRDSLGTLQAIVPGEVNWMTAGSGIAHSERTGPEARARGGVLSGLQAWVALPRDQEEGAPGFAHLGRDALPMLDGRGWRARLIAGTFDGERAPTPVASPTVYADVLLGTGARFDVPAEHEERAVYLIEGDAAVGGRPLRQGALLVLRPGHPVAVEAASDARLMLIGGATMDGPRHIWWNFVASSRERIEQAKADWTAGRFAGVPGETEFIPLPTS